MIIGLIVSETNKPSERFLETDIEIYESLGHQVKIFANNPQSDTPYKTLNILSLHFLLTFFRALLFKPKAVCKHIFLENKANGFLQSIKNTLKSLHILSEETDVLIYAFGSLIIDKKYLAQSKNIPSIISFRGADVGILPLSKPDFYNGIVGTSFHFVSKNLKDLF